MARQDFLDNFRTARNLFIHSRVPASGAGATEQLAARAAIWLTPKSIKGFNADEFRELGLDRQKDLQVAIRDFTEIAQQVHPYSPATPEQLGSARIAFQKILHILMPYLPTPQEGDKVEEALKSVDFPSWAVNWDYELGSDHDGEPAVWVNLYVDETTAPRKEFGRFASRMTTAIHEALSRVGSTRWPYIRVRTAAEHKTS